MPDVITVGEGLVVLEPHQQIPLDGARTLVKRFGGAECNFSVGISRLGLRAGWIGRIGDDPFGRFIVSRLKKEGVDVSCVKCDAVHPTGLYVKEKFSSGGARMFYYRKNSSGSRLFPQDIQERYFRRARWLHITGITPLLSESCYSAVRKAVALAKKHKLLISYDPNVRMKLVKENRNAKKVLREFVHECNYFLPGEEELSFLYGGTDYKKQARKIVSEGVRCVVVKLGAKGAWYAAAEEEGFVKAKKVKRVADVIGAGDAFAAGFAGGILLGGSLRGAVRLAHFCASKIVQVQGDYEGFPKRIPSSSAL